MDSDVRPVKRPSGRLVKSLRSSSLQAHHHELLHIPLKHFCVQLEQGGKVGKDVGWKAEQFVFVKLASPNTVESNCYSLSRQAYMIDREVRPAKRPSGSPANSLSSSSLRGTAYELQTGRNRQATSSRTGLKGMLSLQRCLLEV